MNRQFLLWQIRWLLYHHAIDRLYFAAHDPLWRAYEVALESGDWDEYRAMYEARG